ncbi:MAG TPA: GDSL-type esterase/lipase family protein [Acetobacteraceae bacterium]|nr:GDSL-type esterase/lipase family protein [Acetobacteraceae bacterium]
MSAGSPRGVRVLAWAVAAVLLLVAAPVMAKPAGLVVSALPHVARRIAHARPLRIVAFGSSSTEGVGASTPAATYPSRLEAFLRTALPVPVEVVNAGIGGEDADDMARRIPAVLAQQPDLVIWQTGSNDPLRDVPLDRFEERTREGIVALRAGGADVMLMEPQDCQVLRDHPGAFAYRDSLREIAAQMQAPLVRRFDLMHEWVAEGLLTPAQMLYTDGLHMTDGGYAQLANAVGRQMLTLLHRHAGTHYAGTAK